MIFKDFKVIFPDRIETMSLQIRDGKIISFDPDFSEDEVMEGNGRYLSPGFIDIHIHGAGNHDTMEASFEAMEAISTTVAEHGTTTCTSGRTFHQRMRYRCTESELRHQTDT